MYPASYAKPQPCGLGFEWTLEGDRFVKRLIRRSNASLEAIQWIDSMQNDSRFVDKNGLRQRIQSAWWGEEKQLGTIDKPMFVDGYVRVDDEEYVLEYNGCAYHGCSKCKTEYLGSPQKIKDDAVRIRKLKKKYTVIEITSCEWYKQRQNPEVIQNPTISPFLHETSKSEAELIRAIEEEIIFGFCVIDLTPTEAARKWESANWGPLFEHIDVTYDMLPSWMAKEVDKKDYPKRQLVQTFDATNYFCSTRMAKFYIDHGYKITKLHQLIEYEPAAVLQMFHDKVWNLRSEATRDGNKCLAQAAKNAFNARKSNIYII